MNAKFTAWTTMLLCIVMSCTSGIESKDNAPSGDVMKREEISNLEISQTATAADSIGEIPAPPPDPQQSASPKEKQLPQAPAKPAAIEWDKKIVKTARLQAEVKDYHAFGRQVTEQVTRFGGYVSNEEQHTSDYRMERTMTIRVPVDRFDGAVAALLTNTEAVAERSISADDVTSQMVDGRSRLEAKRQVRLRYLELLKTAKNMEDILTVQREINAIQEEIERVGGQLNLLQHTSAMSTIHFTFYQVLKPNEKPADDSTFLARVGGAFKTGWTWIGEIFLALVYLWPVVALLAAAVVLYRKRKKNSSRPVHVADTSSSV